MDLLRKIVVSGKVAEHPDGLVEGAITIISGETVLLEEVVLQETGNLALRPSQPRGESQERREEIPRG